MTEERTPVWSRISRSSRIILVMGTVLLVLAATGVLQADRNVEVSSEEAVEIARGTIDFQPENVQVRLVRQGIGLRPVWAVSLSIPLPNSSEFERLVTVEIDAGNGGVLRTVTSS